MNYTEHKKTVIDTVKNPLSNDGIKVNTLEQAVRRIGKKIGSKSKYMRELFFLEMVAL